MLLSLIGDSKSSLNLCTLWRPRWSLPPASRSSFGCSIKHFPLIKTCGRVEWAGARTEGDFPTDASWCLRSVCSHLSQQSVLIKRPLLTPFQSRYFIWMLSSISLNIILPLTRISTSLWKPGALAVGDQRGGHFHTGLRVMWPWESCSRDWNSQCESVIIQGSQFLSCCEGRKSKTVLDLFCHFDCVNSLFQPWEEVKSKGQWTEGGSSEEAPRREEAHVIGWREAAHNPSSPMLQIKACLMCSSEFQEMILTQTRNTIRL